MQKQTQAFTIADSEGMAYQAGLTKIEYFTAMAMQGLIAGGTTIQSIISRLGQIELSKGKDPSTLAIAKQAEEDFVFVATRHAQVVLEELERIENE